MEYRLQPVGGANLRTFLRLLIAAALLLVGASVASAQTPAPSQPQAQTTVSAEELERLVNTLESEADRKRLVEQLKGLIAAERGKPAEEPGLGQAILTTLSGSVERMSQTVQEIGTALLDIRRVGAWLERSLDDAAAREAAFSGLWRVLAVLALGAIAQILVTLVLRRVRSAVTPRQGGLGWRIGAGLLALVLDALPIAAFAAASYGSLPFPDPAPSARLIAIALVNAVVFSHAVVLLVRLVLQPHEPALRIPRLSDSTAAYLYIWMRRFIWLAVVGYVALEAARSLGLPRSAHAGLLSLLGLIIAALLIMVILQNRKEVATWLKRHREGEPVGPMTALRFRIADTWHVLAILYIVAVYVVWLLRPDAGLQFLLRATLFSAAALLVGWLLERGIERMIKRWFSVGDEFKARFPELETRANRYLPLVLNITRVAVTLLTILAILFIWGVTSFSILIDEPGRRIVFSLLRIVGVVIGGLLLWELGGLALERLLTRATSKGRMPAARVQTMLPVARYIFGLILGIVVALMLLSEIGVDIGPLLAGAGVVGLAVGLGAQTLVKDLIAGFSLIMEDALAVGDVVRIGQNSGVVEAMNIRSLRLRGFDGTVQTIPLGGVTIVENMTKDYSFAVIDCGVAYKEDVDRVIALLKEIGAEMQEDANFAPDILAPLEVVGLDKFQDSSLLIKARFKTYPIKQWNVMREFNRRMKARFDKEGIEIPFPYRTLTFDSETLKAFKQLGGASSSGETAPTALPPPKPAS